MQSLPWMTANELCRAHLRSNDLSIIANICVAAETSDLAIRLGSTDLGVIRCATDATHRDRSELAKMLAEGDFVWAGLVYENGEASNSDMVEAFHVSELDKLTNRLLALRGARHDAR